MHINNISFFFTSYFILFTLAAPPPNQETEVQDKNTGSSGGCIGYGGSFSIAGPGADERNTQGGTTGQNTAPPLGYLLGLGGQSTTGGSPPPGKGGLLPAEGPLSSPNDQIVSGGLPMPGEGGPLSGPSGQVVSGDPLAPGEGVEALELIGSGPSGTSVQGGTF